MSRRQNPLVAIVAYFEQAPLEVAESALALARTIVQRRSGATTRRRRATAVAAPAPSTQPDEKPRPPARPIGAGPVAVADPSLTPARRRRRAAPSVPAAPAAAPQQSPDLALPGLGPSTVGD